ncbi:MAG: hypothetical protein ACKOXU_14995 [Limnohabitans sp.]
MSGWRPDGSTAAISLAVTPPLQLGNKGSTAITKDTLTRAMAVETATPAVTVSSSLR